MADDEPSARYTARDLAARAGVSERTVRFYVAEGLLPPPVGRGRGAHYEQAHLTRLRLIRALQKGGGALETVRDYLDELGEDEAKAEAALRVWEDRQERAGWAQAVREKLGAPATLYRYGVAEGVDLVIEASAAPGRAKLADVLGFLRKAFAEDY
jgi:DNA-binding transcriptional MerR regulator